MRFFGVSVFLAVVGLTSCQKWQEDQLDASWQQTLYGMKYGEHQRNVLDIALPANRTTETPVVIFIHGGAWVLGDKGVFATEIQQFASEGIACATVNYRFASDLTDTHHPELHADIRAVVDHIASKSELWQVSPTRFGIVGHSAGGHLSLLTSYTLNSDGRIKACAAWAGPSNFLDADQLAIDGAYDIFDTYTGTGLSTSSDTALYMQASPYWMAHVSVPPTLLVHGTQDELVPYSNSVRLQQRLDSLGVTNSLTTLQNAAHIWTGNDLDTARSVTLHWFQLHL